MYTPTEVLVMQDLLSKEEMLDRKLWDARVLETGGISYYYPESKLGIDNADTLELKKRYRVSCTYKDKHTKLLKFKIRKADGEIFSVAAKTQAESQAVVDILFGKRMYHVSQMMV